MVQFLIGGLILGLIYLALHFFARANTQSLAKTLNQLVGVVLFGIGIMLLLTVRFAPLALPVFLAGAAVLFGDRLPFLRGGGKFGGMKGAGGLKGKASKVKTMHFHMHLDHKSGEMDGEILTGQFKGKRLSGLQKDEFKALYEEITSAKQIDTDSLSLLETYLDSVIATWREDFHVNGAAGHSSAAGTGAITEEEAYEILGLGRGAGVAEIRAAHRRLMLKLHPDRGGSTVLAAKINEAKDVLLGLHSSNS